MLTAAPATPRLALRLLGAFGMEIDGVPVRALPPKKARWLLALLALRSGGDTDRAWLAETLWPDSDPEKALYNLRYSLVALRKTVGDALLAPTPRTLSLDPAQVWVDVAAFRAGAKTTSGRTSSAALYRGPLLEGCDEAWVTVEREALAQAYGELLEALARDAAEAADWSAAAGWLRRLVVADPFRESAHRDLMRALAAAGDGAAVEMAWQSLRRTLRDRLNAAPSPETRALYEDLRAASPAPFPPPPAPPTVRGFLPIPLTELIARDAALEEIAVALQRNRLVTLTGPGGIGKTRLAIAAAQRRRARCADGAWFVDLAPLTRPEQVAQQVLETVGGRFDGATSVEDALAHTLGAMQTLVVLDNCEHLAETCRALADRLLSRCLGLTVLATSRERLGIVGEQVYPVPPLALPPAGAPHEKNPQALLEYSAVRLFVERAVQASPTFALTGRNAGAVTQVCRSLDGLPLAIEMAAARVRSLSATEIQTRLTDRFALLTTGSKTALPRHQTLRALIDWSHELLTEPEKALLSRLAVFSGGWTLEAAEAVADLPDTLDLLQALVDRSLVVVENEASGTRYRMLETVLEYARERLAQSPDRTVVHARQLDYYRSLAERLEDSEGELTRAPIAREQENLRRALAWARGPEGDLEKGVLLVRHLYWFWLDTSRFAEGYRELEALLARVPPETKTQLHSTLIRRLGDLAFRLGRDDEALERLERSIALDRELGDPGWEGRGHYLKALVLEFRGAWDEARVAGESALAAFRAVGDSEWELATLIGLTATCRMADALDDARDYLAAAYAMGPETGMLLRARQYEALVWAAQGRYDDARRQLAALHFDNPLQDRQLLGLRVDLERAAGQADRARDLLTEYLRQAWEAQDTRGAVAGLEDAALLLGAGPRAAQLLAAADATGIRPRARRPCVADDLARLRAQCPPSEPSAAPLEQGVAMALAWLSSSEA